MKIQTLSSILIPNLKLNINKKNYILIYTLCNKNNGWVKTIVPEKLHPAHTSYEHNLLK